MISKLIKNVDCFSLEWFNKVLNYIYATVLLACYLKHCLSAVVGIELSINKLKVKILDLYLKKKIN